ncbi:unnamed protein product [Tilletia caries]|nr:unnamed protein product [Tilletia caries]CAD7062438.1 unnamed protein product [Tilletia caries]
MTPTFSLHPCIVSTHHMDAFAEDDLNHAHRPRSVPYMCARIQPDANSNLFTNVEDMGIEGDTSLQLPSHERAPVREVDWSPVGFTSAQGSYLSILTSGLKLLLYEATPNGWTGSWKESASLPVPVHDSSSKREAFLDSHIVAHRWTGSASTAAGNISFLLASTRHGRVAAWRFEAGTDAAPTCVKFRGPDTFHGHIVHIVACSSWSEAQTSASSSDGGADSAWACFVALWSPAQAQVAIVELRLSTSSGQLETQKCHNFAGQCHYVSYARFIDSTSQLIIATPGTIILVDVTSEPEFHRHTFSLQPSTAGPSDVSVHLSPVDTVIDASPCGAKKVRVTTSHGGIYYLDTDTVQGGATTSTLTVYPAPELLTIHLEGQAEEATQEEISVRRRMNGYVEFPSCGVGDLPRVVAVLQDTAELASLTHRQMDHRSETVALMLTHPFNNAATGADEEEVISMMIRRTLKDLETVQASVPDTSATYLFAPLVLLFLGASSPSQRRILDSTWRSVQPFTDEAWIFKASIWQLRAMYWVMDWLQRMGIGPFADDLKAAQHRIRKLLEVRNLKARIVAAGQKLDNEEAESESVFYTRLSAAAVLLSKETVGSEAAEANAMLLEHIENHVPGSKESILEQWQGNISSSGGIDLGEQCPACASALLLTWTSCTFRLARCVNRHVWKRCSVTLELLSDQPIRVCTGCGGEAVAMVAEGRVGKLVGWRRAVASASRCPNCASLWATL